ncbi:uncharacterized protein LOC124362627 [Homalodisca vitripennis]|uniref:uncharacterized protein LOC124362627 n=1 Tax=Homalodisca vitripennis TaxID=197043 RepID=UPI001EEA7E3F|nr:uncharacterized protein LOC124362627 [Homalodisca vitripennis]
MSETQEVVAVETDEDIDMEKLIMFVEERSLLWDKSIEEYKDRNKNREAWREICHALFPGFEDKSASEKKQLGDNLLKKWRNIRDRWMKHIRQDKDSKRSGAGASKIKKYIYHDQLQFLKKIAHQHDTESSINVPEGNNSVSPTEDIIDNTGTRIPAQPNKPKVTRKRKRNEDEFELKMMKILEQPYDEEETYFGFFRSMVPTLKTFTTDQFVEFQLGVLGVLKNVKAQGQGQGTSQVPTSQYQQVHYPYPGSQPQNVYCPQQQPQFAPQFSNQTYINPYIRPIHPHTSTSSEQYYPMNQQTSQEASNQQPTPPSRTPTPHRATATPASSVLSLDFEGDSNDFNI